MKTPEEIRIGLECRGDKRDPHCVDCPYHGKGLTPCRIAVCEDALAIIDQLEERIALMLIQMKGDCGVCKHRSGCWIGGRDIAKSITCYECMMNESRPNWEYEGLPQ